MCYKLRISVKGAGLGVKVCYKLCISVKGVMFRCKGAFYVLHEFKKECYRLCIKRV